jgi:hypothetical protein
MLKRELTPACKVLSEADGTVEYIASDESVDSDREVIRAAGWRFTRLAKNAPFVDSHDYSSITKVLGRVEDFRVEGGRLVERVRYTREPGTLGGWAFKMVRDGFLKAVSVGFVPLRALSRFDANPLPFAAELATLGLAPAEADRVRVIFTEQEQLELSQCLLGANPNALAKAYKNGTLAEEELDQLSGMIAASKTASPTTDRADVVAATRRAKLAFMLKIQTNL